MPKGACLAEVMLNTEKIKPVALAIIELCLSEGISQPVTRKFHLIIFFKFHSNLLKAFQVDLKACCMGLVLHNQYWGK